MKLKTVKTIFYILSGIISVLLVTMLIMQTFGYVYIVIGIAIASVVFLSVFWRCPKCSKVLGRIEKYDFCQHCGTKLDT